VLFNYYEALESDIVTKSIVLKTETNKKEYLDISSNKLHDSCILCMNQRFEGACYNAGYTIECMVKFIFLEEFKCDNRQNLIDLYRNPPSCVRRIYSFCTGINDFRISIFGMEYTKCNIKDFESICKDVYNNVLSEHTFEYGLTKLKDYKKTKVDLNNYKYLLDWSEQWRYRLLTNKELKNGVMIKKLTPHDLNDQGVCHAIIKEINELIQQLYSDDLISQKDYNLYYKNILEKEVHACLNTSAQ